MIVGMNHFFCASDLRDTTARLAARDVACDLRRQATSGTWQLFCHGPNGAKVEPDFDATEAP